MISEEYTVVLLLDSSDACANLITLAFSTTGQPHLLRHEKNPVEFKDYLTKSIENQASEKYIKPRLILISADELDDELRGLLKYIKTHELLKLIPVVVFCATNCETAIGRDSAGYINSYIQRTNNTDKDKETITTLANYWLKWNNLPP